MIDALVASLIVANIATFGLLWYRLGRVEGILKEHCRSSKEGKHG